MEFTEPDLEHMKFLEKATQEYEKTWKPGFLSYLDGRGVKPETAEYFRLGQVVDPLPGHERYQGYMAIPYLKMGRVVAMKFRCMEDHKCRDIEGHSKHYCDGGQWVYNSDAIKSPREVAAWFEGEPDTWIGHQIGFAAFGYPSATSFKGHPWWVDLHQGFATVLAFPDNDASKKDNPGMQGGQLIRQADPRVRLVIPPPDRDVTDMYLDGGASSVWQTAGLEWNDVQLPRLQLVG